MSTQKGNAAGTSTKPQTEVKVVLTKEEKLAKANEKARESMLKSLRTQADLVFMIGFKNGPKLKTALQTLKALSEQIESEIEPELPFPKD